MLNFIININCLLLDKILTNNYYKNTIDNRLFKTFILLVL